MEMKFYHEDIKESFLNEIITVSLEVSGLSKDGTFFRFKHNFYNSKGENLAFCEIFGAWINLNTRKLSALPEHLLKLRDQFPKTDDFKFLTKEDTRASGIRPVNLSL